MNVYGTVFTKNEWDALYDSTCNRLPPFQRPSLGHARPPASKDYSEIKDTLNTCNLYESSRVF